MKMTGGAYHPHGEIRTVDGEKVSRASSGATIRDKFADTALRGLIGSSIALHYSPNEYAATAYMIADAMIAERAK